MPEVEEELEALALKRSQFVNVKANCLRRDRKTKHTIAQRADIEGTGHTSND
jgi:hypothetical protein